MKLEQLQRDGEAPSWMTEEGYKVLQNYLLPSESPRGLYSRLAKAAASYQKNKKTWEAEFFDVMWKNWLCPASPVLANLGTKRGMPISCNGIHSGDSVDSIFDKSHEMAMLTKNGAGVAVYLGDIRGRGTEIYGNGRSEGVVPWAKVFDTTINSVSQGSTRRGSGAAYLPIDHKDIEEFLQIRRVTGDVNRRCLNLNHAVCIPNYWMQEMLQGDKSKRLLWQEVLKARVETGEPYLFFSDNVNDARPTCYKDANLSISFSNICSEIALYSDPDHSYICCLSSLNLVRWEEWKDTNLPATATRFLDAVMSEYIDKSENISGLEASRRSAIKGRALGLGVLGWHSLLQDKMLPFDSFESMTLNANVFRTIQKGAEEATVQLAKESGEPEWCKGYNRRNTHLMAVAPTVSNSTISGGHSAGIEPLSANVYSVKSSSGTFIRKNQKLQECLANANKDTPEVWKSINEQSGSVQHLDLPKEIKDVFLTAREVNQHAIIKQAAQRQAFIDQGQSINLFFASNSSPRYIHDVHIAAWESKLKTLYYLRMDGVIKGDLASRSKDECVACGG